MEYRKVTSLTESEIKEMVKFLFDVDNVVILNRNEEEDTIFFGFETVWGEDIVIEDTFEISPYGIVDLDNDYPLYPRHEECIEKFLVAKGCHYLQKNNPF